MHKRLFILYIISACACASTARFISPIGYIDTQANRQRVVSYIEARVHDQYCRSALKMCSPASLRRMERANLEAFQALLQTKDKNLLKTMIRQYCNGGLNMCSYVTLNRMYAHNLEAKHKKLKW